MYKDYGRGGLLYLFVKLVLNSYFLFYQEKGMCFGELVG